MDWWKDSSLPSAKDFNDPVVSISWRYDENDSVEAWRRAIETACKGDIQSSTIQVVGDIQRHVDDAMISPLVKAIADGKAPNLKYLYLRNCPKVTDETGNALVKILDDTTLALVKIDLKGSGVSNGVREAINDKLALPFLAKIRQKQLEAYNQSSGSSPKDRLDCANNLIFTLLKMAAISHKGKKNKQKNYSSAEDYLREAKLYYDEARDIAQKQKRKNFESYDVCADILEKCQDEAQLEDEVEHWQKPTSELPSIVIISLDGGGIRGISEIVILQKLMEQIDPDNKKMLPEICDLICGTSTGSIVAMGLRHFHSEGRTVRDSLNNLGNLFYVLGEKIFGITVWGPLRAIRNHGWYDVDKYEGLLQDILRDTKLDDDAAGTTTRALAVGSVIDKNDDIHHVLFSTYDPNDGAEKFKEYYTVNARITDVPVWQAVRASSAAPMYFSPFTIGKKEIQDGGFGLNNPAELAFREAEQIWKGRNIIMISIGTGVKSAEKAKQLHGFSWSRIHTLFINMASDCARADDFMQRAVEDSKIHKGRSVDYFRFNAENISHIGLHEWKEMRGIADTTTKYLSGHEATEKMGQLKQLLENNRFSLMNSQEESDLQ